MTISTIDVILDRISIASEESPIAVFDVGEAKNGRFDAVFGATVRTQERIGAYDYIGSFHRLTKDTAKDALNSLRRRA